MKAHWLIAETLRDPGHASHFRPDIDQVKVRGAVPGKDASGKIPVHDPELGDDASLGHLIDQRIAVRKRDGVRDQFGPDLGHAGERIIRGHRCTNPAKQLDLQRQLRSDGPGEFSKDEHGGS
ncbi:MAG TPA: hypothetical protein VHR67_10100 [Aestuariivirgaceae bacterium]|jgi:hypothetical protein|nr:hypothetical protein [Aestuariivirgaceae bacterium]